MRRVLSSGAMLMAGGGVLMLAACQSPTNPDDTLKVDDFLEITVTPNPAIADVSTDGRTYRVVRGNNQPDEVLPFDWRTSFTLSLLLNDRADDKNGVKFPVDLTAIALVVKQASGGIVTPPTGGEVEHYDYVTRASGNRFASINTGQTITFDVWYDLPSQRKEALVTVTLNFVDADSRTFSKAYDVRVAP